MYNLINFFLTKSIVTMFHNSVKIVHIVFLNFSNVIIYF